MIFAGKDVDRLGGRNRRAHDGCDEGERLQPERDRKAKDDERHQSELDRRERGRAANVGPQAVHRHAKADGEESASRQGVRQYLEIGVDRSWHWNACRGPGDADQGRKHHGIEDHVASEFPRREDRSARAMGIKLLHEHRRGEHDHRDKHRRDRRGQHRRSSVSRLEDRKRDEAGVRHRGGPSLHGRLRKPLAAESAQRCKDDCEAQQGPAAERNQKAPRQQGSRGLVRDRDNQQRWHRDVIGEVDQGVGQVARDVSEVAGEPSGHDHREHRQDEIGDLHCLQAERPVRHIAIVLQQCPR